MSIKIAVALAVAVCCIQVLHAAPSPAPAPWSSWFSVKRQEAVDLVASSGKSAKDWLSEKSSDALSAISNVAASIKKSAIKLKNHVASLTEDVLNSLNVDQILEHIERVGDEIEGLVERARKQISATLTGALNDSEKQINAFNDQVSEAVAAAEDAGVDVSECEADRVADEVRVATEKARSCMADKTEDALTMMSAVIDIGKESKRIVKMTADGVKDCAKMPGWPLTGICSGKEFLKSLVKMIGLGVDTVSLGVDGTSLVVTSLRKQLTVCIKGVTEGQANSVEQLTEQTLACIEAKKTQ